MLDTQFQTPAIPEMITFFSAVIQTGKKLEINRYKGAGGQRVLAAENLNLLQLQIAWDIKIGGSLDKWFARCHILGNSWKFSAGVCQLQRSGELIEKPALLLKGSFLSLELQIAQSTLSAVGFFCWSIPSAGSWGSEQDGIFVFMCVFISQWVLAHPGTPHTTTAQEKFGINRREMSYKCPAQAAEGFSRPGYSMITFPQAAQWVYLSPSEMWIVAGAAPRGSGLGSVITAFIAPAVSPSPQRSRTHKAAFTFSEWTNHGSLLW